MIRLIASTKFCQPRLWAGQHLSSLRRELVIAPSALSALLYPQPLDPLPFLQPVKEWIQRRSVKTQCAAGALIDQLAESHIRDADSFEEGQNQQLRAALFPIRGL